MKKWLVVLLCLALTLSLVACGSNNQADRPAAGENEQNTADAGNEAGNDSKKTIYFLTKILGNQYWSVVEQGARDAAEELGVNLVITGLANEAEVEKQIQQLQDAVSANADGIVIGPTDSTALTIPVSEAHASGIPIVIVDTMINSDDYDVAYMTNNIEAGRMAAEAMIRLLREAGVSEDEKAQIAVQIGSSGSQTIIDRLEGFNSYWDEHAPEKWEVLNDDIKVNDGDISKAVGFTQDFLTTYPDLKGVFGPNNGSTVGFVIGLQEADRTDLAMVGFDFSPEMEDMIRSEKFHVATVVQRQYLMGYEGVKAAYELSEGKEPAEKLVDTGVLVVDINNIDDEEVQKIIDPTR